MYATSLVWGQYQAIAERSHFTVSDTLKRKLSRQQCSFCDMYTTVLLAFCGAVCQPSTWCAKTMFKCLSLRLLLFRRACENVPPPAPQSILPNMMYAVRNESGWFRGFMEQAPMKKVLYAITNFSFIFFHEVFLCTFNPSSASF